MSFKLMAFSGHWDKLLHYGSSLPSENFFYLSSDRKNEVAKSLEAIKGEHKVGRLKKIFACAFPARYKLLQKEYNELENRSCPELKEWLDGFSATSVYLIYSSSYPNNPASIFGHTFLRFDREVEKTNSSDLRGYSVAFMATTNPNDNPLSYTFKGLTGGYDGHLSVKPYYINVGIYNNSESRDLWEYEIPLNDEEREFLILHLWEFMNNTGFPYYFFDDNCSWMMLKLIEIARPSINFDSTNDILIIPQETIQEAVSKFGINKRILRESLGEKIQQRFSNLSFRDQRKFRKAYNSEEELRKIVDYKTLETLALEWKFTNYKKQTNLSPSEKKLFMLTHEMLSQKESPNVVEKRSKIRSGPEKSHSPHLVSIFLAQNISRLTLRYGLNDIHDSPVGNPTNSYINFLGIDLSVIEDKLSLESLKIIDIKSLENFSFYYPKLSWFGDLNFRNLDDKRFATAPVASGGIGLSKYFGQLRLFMMPGFISWYANSSYEIEAIVKPGLTLNAKNLHFSVEYNIVISDHKNTINSHTISLGYTISQNNFIILKHETPVYSQDNNLGIEYKHYY